MWLVQALLLWLLANISESQVSLSAPAEVTLQERSSANLTIASSMPLPQPLAIRLNVTYSSKADSSRIVSLPEQLGVPSALPGGPQQCGGGTQRGRRVVLLPGLVRVLLPASLGKLEAQERLQRRPLLGGVRQGGIPAEEPQRHLPRQGQRRLLQPARRPGVSVLRGPGCRLREGGAEGVVDGPRPAADRLVVCGRHLVAGRLPAPRLAGLPVLLLLHQAGRHAGQVRAAGLHELPAKEHGRLEHRQRAAGLHRRPAQHLADDLGVLQQRRVAPDLRGPHQVRPGSLLDALRRALHRSALLLVPLAIPGDRTQAKRVKRRLTSPPAP
ncbi:cystinosin isoform X3 [Phycodurus eques]|uniref:cystinosin isoform X3 n=1 Tax=Phycodurus eques TaxID=693459 RepID=UPI002ACE7402|nr:cystinosin isoform X3 [Phycodurus eques]